MLAKSAIQKGKDLENYICDQLKEKGLDEKAYRSHGSGNGNNEKADIWTKVCVLGKNIGIEAKNHKTPHIKDWWEQTCKLEKLGREPVLVYKLKGESLGEAKAVIYLDTLLELIKRQEVVEVGRSIIKDDTYTKRTALSKIDYAIDALKQAKRQLNKE